MSDPREYMVVMDPFGYWVAVTRTGAYMCRSLNRQDCINWITARVADTDHQNGETP